MKCREFFTKHAENRDRCKELQKLANEGEDVLRFEAESASEDSPGPVKNAEHLWRQIINPTHFDSEKNEIKATAFADVSDKGGSVNRDYEPYESVYAKAVARVADLNQKKPEMNAKLVGLVRLGCLAVREITTEINSPGKPVRGFIVVDTALKGDESHADICQITSQPGQSRAVRSRLVEIANQYLQEHILSGSQQLN